MLYTVYHLLKHSKVGVTKRSLELRAAEQGCTLNDMTVLYTTNCLDTASNKEEEMQEKFGYSPDSFQSYKQSTINKMVKTRKFTSPTTHNAGINRGLKSRAELLAFLRLGPLEIGTKGFTGVFSSEDQFQYLVDTAIQSQYESGDFYWSTSLLQIAHTLGPTPHRRQSDNDMDLPYPSGINRTFAVELIPQFSEIREWANARGIYTKGDAKTQFLKLLEEVGELSRGILKADQDEIIDALGDTLVVLINLSHLCGYNLEYCLHKAFDVIQDRKGKMVNGTFVKD